MAELLGGEMAWVRMVMMTLMLGMMILVQNTIDRLGVYVLRELYAIF